MIVRLEFRTQPAVLNGGVIMSFAELQTLSQQLERRPSKARSVSFARWHTAHWRDNAHPQGSANNDLAIGNLDDRR
jgi:hypothetical protein